MLKEKAGTSASNCAPGGSCFAKPSPNGAFLSRSAYGRLKFYEITPKVRRGAWGAFAMSLVLGTALVERPGAGGERFWMRSQVLQGAGAVGALPLSSLSCFALGSDCSLSRVEVVISDLYFCHVH